MTEFNPTQLAQLDRARLSSYQNNLDFYNGQQWQQRSNKRQLVFNYAKVAIDKVTSYLMAGLNFDVEPVEETEQNRAKAQRAEQVLYQVYEDSSLQQLDFETEIDCAILGDACYKVTYDVQQKRIRVTAPDVRGIYAWWLGDDLSRVWRVASRYELTAEEVGMLHGFKASKKKVAMVEVWTEQYFSLFIDNAAVETKPNPYGFIPFIIFPNIRQPKQFWGVSDIPQLTQPQRELNRALSQLSRILEVSGNPIAVLEGVESSEDIKVEPGAVWNLPEEAKAYLLDLLQGGGVRLHIDYIDHIYRCLHDVTETPRAAFGGVERDLSGVALEVELQSLLQKVRRKRTIRTAAYRNRNGMILNLHRQFNREEFGDITHRVIWGAVLPQDRARMAQDEQLLVQSGVHSRRTAMDEMGVDNPDREFERWMEERKRILQMNQEFRARSTRGGERERAVAAETEVPE